MKVFAQDIGAADLYLTVAEYVTEHDLKEGQTFSLSTVEVTSLTTYKVVRGLAWPQKVAFPEACALPMENK